MTTLRRNLIQKFIKMIQENTLFVKEEGDRPEFSNEQTQELAEYLADAAIEVFFPVQPEPLNPIPDPKFDVRKAGIDWMIAAGVEIRQEDLDKEQLEKRAIDAFESAFSIKGNWNWYPAKPQDERVWKKLREFVVKLYLTDKDSFTKYVTWIAQPYSRGAMTGLQIKRNPQDFPDAWASFCMATKYQAPRVQADDADRDDLDANGIPLSY